MRKMNVPAAAAALAIISGCAVQQTSEEVAATATAPAPALTQEEIAAMSTEEKAEIYNQNVTDDKDRVICKKRKKTGSHFSVTECRTVAELEAEKEAADRLLKETSRRGPGVEAQ